MHDLMSCKIQGKYMQFLSLVQGLSRVKEKILRWWPLIRALLDLSKKRAKEAKGMRFLFWFLEVQVIINIAMVNSVVTCTF